MPNQSECMTITDGRNGHGSESIMGASKIIFSRRQISKYEGSLSTILMSPRATWVGLWPFFLSPKLATLASSMHYAPLDSN